MPGFFDAVDSVYQAQQAGLEAGLRGEQGVVPDGTPACMAAWNKGRAKGLCCRTKAAKPH